jgi:hypothetical protein
MPAQEGDQVFFRDITQLDKRSAEFLPGNFLLLQSRFQLLGGEQTLADQQITEPKAHISTSKPFVTTQIVKEIEEGVACLIFAKTVSSKKVHS